MDAKKIFKRIDLLRFFGFLTLIVFLIFLMTKYHQRQVEDANVTVKIGDMKRESTIEGFYDLEEFVEYFTHAIETQDLDAYLRGCALEEKAAEYPFNYYMDQDRDNFSYDYATLPSGRYEEYIPANQMLLSQIFIEQYDALMKQLIGKKDKKKTKISIKTVRVLKTKEQMDVDFIQNLKTRSSRWGTDFMIELAAYVTVGKKSHYFTFMVARYNEAYKLFNLKGSLDESDEDIFAQEISKKDFQKIAVYKNLNLFAHFLESQVQDTIPEDFGLDRSVKNPSSAVLPLNYYLADQKGSVTAREAVRLFMIEICRGNTEKCLNYCYLYKKGDNFEERLKNQNKALLSLTYLYKGIFGLPYAVGEGKSIPYKKIGIRSNQVRDKMDPAPFYGLFVDKIWNLGHEVDQQYAVQFMYNKKVYLCAFTMKLTDDGWKIISFGAENAHLKNGEVSLIKSLSQ